MSSSLIAPDAWRAPSREQLDAIYPEIALLYLDLHRNPELSLHEEQTAAKIAVQLRRLGFDVTTEVGGTGVVGVLRNGAGPTVMIRAELDALPVAEKTVLDYASRVTTKDDLGVEVPVAHACGHDLHMSIGIGTATLLAHNKDRWRGTFNYVAQPAEEIFVGATAMLRDGLFTRFPRPDYALAVHDTVGLPAGKVGYTPGFTLSGVDSVEVTIHGRGSHGALPQDSVDPIVIAARTVLAWQTIVSREIDPRDPAVVTVGSIHGGTRANVIPDEVRMQLTVRSYKPEVRKHLLSAISRIADAEATAAGAEKKPTVNIIKGMDSTYNDPKLTQRVASALRLSLGDSNVLELPPDMPSDDFAQYTVAGVPALLFRIGAVEPEKFDFAQKTGQVLPGPHSPFFAPDRERSLRTGIAAETAAVLELLGRP
jgi:amidohydrolase